MTYNPWRDIHERYPEVHIEWHPILPAQAFFSHRDDVIIVDESITVIERRCALAHEIAHLDVGDRPTEHCWFKARQETNADKLAARRLVAVRDLAAVMAWTRDPREAAEELNVTVDVLALRWRWMHPNERGFVNKVIARRESVA